MRAFLSHDDADHTGNLRQVFDASPIATFVANWAITERGSSFFDFPPHLSQWVNNRESFDAGDRRLRAVRPPQWDSRGQCALAIGVISIAWMPLHSAS